MRPHFQQELLRSWMRTRQLPKQKQWSRAELKEWKKEGWREKPVMKGNYKRQGCWMTSHSFMAKNIKKLLKLINWWGRQQTNGLQGPSLCHLCRLFQELVGRSCQIASASLIGGQGGWAFSCLQPLHYTDDLHTEAAVSSGSGSDLT